MEQVARAIAGGPRLLLRALAVCFLAALFLLLSHAAADADSRGDAPGLSVSRAVHDTGAAADDIVAPARDTAEPATDVVGDVEDSGRHATERAAGAVEDVAGRTGEAVEARTGKVRDVVEARTGKVRDVVEDTTTKVRDVVDNTTTKVHDVVEDTTQQVAEAEPAPEPVAPVPAPRPHKVSHEAEGPERPAKADSMHESLVAQENPALLVIPVTPAATLSEAAAAVVSSVAVEALDGPVPTQRPAPGATPEGTPIAPGSAGQPAPVSAPAALLGDVAAAADPALVQRALERVLVPPAQRATSPGTTPD